MRWSGLAKAATPLAAAVLGVSATTVAVSGESGASTSGSPITVVGIGPYSGSSAYNYPDEQDAISLYFKKLNSQGGVNGHPVHAIFCTDQGDPNVARSCALKAVSDNAAAVILSSNLTNTIDPILQQNHIPFLVQSIATPDDGTDSYSFPIDAGTGGTSAALAAAVVKGGCKNVGSIYVNGVPTVADIVNAADSALKKQGVTAGIPGNLKIGISPTEVTLQAQVAQLESNGAQCVLPVMTPAEGVLLEQAIATSSNPHLAVGAACSVFSPTALKQLGSNAKNLLIACGGHLPTDNVSAVHRVISSMKASYPSVQTTNFTLADWAMAQIIAAAAKSVHGTVTPASLDKSLSHMTSYSTNGLLPAWTTSKKPVVINGMDRVFNPIQSVWKINSQGIPVPAYNINAATNG